MEKATLSKDPTSGISWLDFLHKPEQETIAALKAAGWRWSSYRQQWYNNRRWPTVPAGIETDDGGQVEYAAERADRLTARAEKATAKSEAAHRAAHAISDMIPLGQPILVGHHSEKRHRRDLDKIHRATDKAVAEYRKAEALESRAESSARHQARKDNPGVVARRIDRLKAERTAFLNQRRPWNERTGRDYKAEPRLSDGDREKLDWYNQQIAENEQLLAEVGGLPVVKQDKLDLRPGDTVRARGSVVLVRKVSQKSIRGDIQGQAYLGDYFRTNRKFDITEITEVIARAGDAGDKVEETAPEPTQAPAPASEETAVEVEVQHGAAGGADGQASFLQALGLAMF